MDDFQLSEHFTFFDLTRTTHHDLQDTNRAQALDYLEKLRNTANNLEIVRSFLGGNRIIVNSCYRCPELNMRVRGVMTSAHCSGEAADIVVPEFGNAYQVTMAIAQMHDLPFDQLIYESTWTHVSFEAARTRRQVLTLRVGGGYLPGVIEHQS